MSLPTITERLSEWRLSETAESRTATAVWDVLASGECDAIRKLYAGRSVYVGGVYRDSSGVVVDEALKCDGLGADPLAPAVRSGGGLYRVEATYSTRPPRQQPEGNSPGYQWGDGLVAADIDMDLDLNPICNSNRKPFPPGTLQEEKPAPTLTVSFYRIGFNIADYLKYWGAINADEWHGFKPGQVKCMSVRPAETIMGDAESRRRILLQASFQAMGLIKVNAARVRLTAMGNLPAIKEVSPWEKPLLDWNGEGEYYNGDGDAITPSATVKPVFLVFRTKQSLSFRALGI